MTDPALFTPGTVRVTAGRLRKGLDLDAATARAEGVAITAAGLASLRVLADRIDQLERTLRAPAARAYDHVPLAQLAT